MGGQGNDAGGPCVRNLGLAGARAWADATDPLAVNEAQKAVRMMRNLGFPMDRTRGSPRRINGGGQGAEGGALHVRNIGLSRGMRAWIDATDSTAAVNAQKAGRYMHNIGLSRVKQWYAVTVRRPAKAHKQCLPGALGLNKGLLAWIATWERERLGRPRPRLCRMKQNGLKRGWNGWCELWHAAVTERKAQRAVKALATKLTMGWNTWSAMCLEAITKRTAEGGEGWRNMGCPRLAGLVPDVGQADEEHCGQGGQGYA